MEVTEVCCPVCGKPLVFDESKDNCFVDDMDEGVKVKQITCQHCGTTYMAWEYEDSEEEEVVCGDQGFGNCFLCGGTLIWSGDFMLSDLDDSIEDDDDDALMQSLTCAHCGAPVEVYHVPENYKKDYPFWNEGNE